MEGRGLQNSVIAVKITLITVYWLLYFILCYKMNVHSELPGNWGSAVSAIYLVVNRFNSHGYLTADWVSSVLTQVVKWVLYSAWVGHCSKKRLHILIIHGVHLLSSMLRRWARIGCETAGEGNCAMYLYKLFFQ